MPELQKVIETFRKRLLGLDSAAAAQLVQAYGPIWLRLKSEIESLIAEVQDKQLSFVQAMRLQRAERLRAQVLSEMSRYARVANGRVTAGQAASVALSQEGTSSVVKAALPRGLTMQTLARVGLEWNVLPREAFSVFVGLAGDGKPLARLLEPLGPEVSQGVREGLAEGIALGHGPVKTAGLIRDRVGMGLTRSLTISRTEILRAYRESTRLQYQANSNIVKGYIRRASLSDATCLACLALDGKRYELDEPLDEHINGRCFIVPDPISYRDLGLDVEDAREEREKAEDWFNRQAPASQRAMMGDSRFEAWQGGEFQFGDMAKIEHNAVWGDQAVTKPLKELVR